MVELIKLNTFKLFNSFSAGFYAMLLYDFEFGSDELLLGVSVPVEGEYSYHAQEGKYLHDLPLFEMLQTPILVVIFFDVSHYTYARYVAQE